MAYRAEIDGLRAVAVIAVIFFHAEFAFFQGGFIGVDVFFVISGYLITSNLLKDLENGRFSLTYFYERRARRIFPALFLVMFTCIPFAWLWMWPEQIRDFAKSLLGASLFSSNFTFLFELGYFSTPEKYKPLLHTWSLSAEEQYYLLYPLLFMILAQFGKRFLFPGLFIIALASLALAQLGGNLKISWPFIEEDFRLTSLPSFAFYMLPTRAWELMVGALVASRLFRSSDLGYRPVGFQVRDNLFGLVGLLLIAWAVIAFDNETPHPSIHTLLPVLGTALVIMFARSGTITASLLSLRGLVGIGLISYSAYLWHYPIFAFARIRSIDTPSSLHFSFLILVSLLCAYLSWKFVESPFRDKNNFSRRTIFLSSIIGTLFFLGVGSLGYLTNGQLGSVTREAQIILHNFHKEKKQMKVLRESDSCHYAGTTDSGNVDRFLSNENCVSQMPRAQTVRLPILIVGDSHAADKMISLRLNGYDGYQATGGGCRLAPSRMSVACSKIANKARKIAERNSGISILVMANDFGAKDVSLETIKETVKYWKDLNLQIVLFSNMPKYPNLEKRSVHNARFNIPEVIENSADSSLIIDNKEIVDYLTGEGIGIINTKELFCSITGSCMPINENGDLLLIDQDHLSRKGAKMFGCNLLGKYGHLLGVYPSRENKAIKPITPRQELGSTMPQC